MRLGEVILFTVEGDPVPQGSMKAFIPKGWKRAVLTSDNPKLKKWRNTVRAAAIKAMGGTHPAGTSVPVRLTLDFYFMRPKSNKEQDKTTRPDLDKLCRSVGDSLTGIVFDDDSQVTELHASKHYGSPRVEIRVEEVLPASRELNFCAGAVQSETSVF
jgi:Holliday junction resolvase RusA-like endonuclease